MRKVHVAVDIGGSSVKITAAGFRQGRIESLKEQALPNAPLSLGGHLYIDIYRLYGVIKDALRALCREGMQPVSFGIDTYGNGYGVLNGDGELMGLPFFYKDARTKGILEAFSQRLPLWDLYESTGVYPTDIRVLMQLFYDAQSGSDRLRQGKSVLLFPDLLAYFFTGEAYTERSLASVSQLLDRDGAWCKGVMRKVGIPAELFAPLVNAAERGPRPILPSVQKELGGQAVSYIDVITHDTESALLAAPLLDERAVFVSLGTSVIFGARTAEPVVSGDSFAGRFKNMWGAFGRNSLCRDYNGLWLLERCMEEWKAADAGLDYGLLLEECRAADANDSYFNVNDTSIRFYKHKLTEAIRHYCGDTGQKIPQTRGEIALCVLESIVLEAKWSYERIKSLTGVLQYARISAVGGGVKNSLLLGMLADALELPLYAGSTYAATWGNILMQLHALGQLPSKEEVLSIAQGMCSAEKIEPKGNPGKWESALRRLEQYRSSN